MFAGDLHICTIMCLDGIHSQLAEYKAGLQNKSGNARLVHEYRKKKRGVNKKGREVVILDFL